MQKIYVYVIQRELMKIGVISDIHSNKVALDAVLRDMEPVDPIVCCGDVVGYGPRPAECVATIQEKCDYVVRGNHDRSANSPEEYRGHDMVYSGLSHTNEQLSEEQLEWILNLPRTCEVEDYLVTHSHPDSAQLDTYVRPRMFSSMTQHLDDYDGLFLGHTHVQHAENADDRLVLNPGSVGQPRDQDKRAAYAVVDTDENSATLHRTEYDIELVQQQVREENLEPRIGERLSEGR